MLRQLEDSSNTLSITETQELSDEVMIRRRSFLLDQYRLMSSSATPAQSRRSYFLILHILATRRLGAIFLFLYFSFWCRTNAPDEASEELRLPKGHPHSRA